MTFICEFTLRRFPRRIKVRYTRFVGTAYVISAENDIESKTDSSGTVTYNYDENGNTIGKSDGIGSVQYGYNAENRLIIAQNESGEMASYAYDVDGIRMAAVNTDGTQVRFVVDKNRPYAQVLGQTL